MAVTLIEKMGYLQSQDLLSVSVYDITGLYSAVAPLNTTGYGVTSFSPNPLPIDILDFRGYIYFPDPTTLLPVTTPFDINNIIADYAVIIYPTLPNLTSVPYTYDSTLVFGQSQAWTEGVFRFHTWSIDSGDAVYETDYLVPIFGSTRCCIKNKILLFPINDSCNSCNQKLIRLLKADLMLDQLDAIDRNTGGLSADETCQLYNKMAEQIIYCQSVCNSDCEPCSSCSNC